MADVYRALWRHKWFILISTFALVAATWALTARQQKIYQASTLVRVQQAVLDPRDPGQQVSGLEASQRLAETYARIVTTSAVVDRVRRAFHGSVSRDEIDLGGEAVPDLALVTLWAKNSDPALAQRIANAIPGALKDLNAATGASSDRIATLDAASRPLSPVSPRPKLNLALALLFGLVFNGALALLIEVLADRLPGVDELERLTGRPVLTTIPNLRFRRTGGRLPGRRADTRWAETVPADPHSPPRAEAGEGRAVQEVRGG